MVETSVDEVSSGSSAAPRGATPAHERTTALGEHEAALDSLVAQAVPAIGDGCVIETRGVTAGMRTWFARVADPARESALAQLARASSATGRAPVLGRVFTSGRPIVAFAPPREREDDDDADHGRVLSLLGARASIALPLVVGRETLGALLVVMGATGREFEPEHLARVQELARRAAVVLAAAREGSSDERGAQSAGPRGDESLDAARAGREGP